MKKKRLVATLAALCLASTMLFGSCDTSAGGESVTTDGAVVQDGGDTTTAAQTSDDTAVTTVVSSTGDPDEEEILKGLNALELTKLMGNGINLGNTMEAYNHKAYLSGSDPTSFENIWGQPTTTQEMIDDMKAMGFDTIRIPVAWTNGMNFESGDYTIDERLMNRVEEIVNYALNADMYVIINDHWDGGWWGMFGSEDMAVREKGMEMYKAMWTQIGQRFGDYSYKLIFESGNEEMGDRLNDSDITGSKGILSKNECYEKTTEINNEFVKLIRSLGGKNEDRFLLIAGYNTDITLTCDDKYVMPDDTADGKLFISVHYYTPWDYCGTDAIQQWGSPDDYEEQNGLLERMTKFTDKGYGVIIGEYAVMKSSGIGQKPDTDKFYKNFLDNCDLYNYCPLLWDCSNLYRRSTGKISDETVAAVFKDRTAADEAGKDYGDIQAKAKADIDAAYELSMETAMKDVSVPASDEYAAAWIMYQSSDWSIAYSVGDTYDPTNKTTGVKDSNVIIEGEGTYTVGLDFSSVNAKGTAFCALGISNGETLFPGYNVTIDEIRINGEPIELTAKDYTCSDDGRCTRVNLYNQWVTTVPEGARRADGNLDGCAAQIMDLGNTKIKTMEVTFTYTAP